MKTTTRMEGGAQVASVLLRSRVTEASSMWRQVDPSDSPLHACALVRNTSVSFLVLIAQGLISLFCVEFTRRPCCNNRGWDRNFLFHHRRRVRHTLWPAVLVLVLCILVVWDMTCSPRDRCCLLNESERPLLSYPWRWPRLNLPLVLPDEVSPYQLAFFRDLESHLGFSITWWRIHAVYDKSLCRVAWSVLWIYICVE